MADTNSAVTVYNSDKFVILELNGVSDGTGQANAIVANASAFTRSIPPRVVQYFSVYEIEGSVQGFPYIQLFFNANTPVVLETISAGAGTVRCWKESGGIVDPMANGWNGNILLTSPANHANGSYSIKLKLKKKRTGF